MYDQKGKKKHQQPMQQWGYTSWGRIVLNADVGHMQFMGEIETLWRQLSAAV